MAVDLLEASKALLAVTKDGLASHPLPAAGSDCLEWCVAEIERLRTALRDAESQRDEWREIATASTSAHQ